MQLIEVASIKDKKAFIDLPLKIYQNDSNWIRPLDKDVQSVFDPTENASYQYGECKRWVLYNHLYEPIGRVAAFYDTRIATEGQPQPTGGMGFFECIDDQSAAFKLFDICKEWLISKGMEAMDGPINFGDRSRWWGLLIDGFEPPAYCIAYNPPYYKAFFENYGFKNYFEQYTFRRKVYEGGLDEIFHKKAERILRDKNYAFRHIRKKDLGKYVNDFQEVYNKSWIKHQGVNKQSEEEIQKIFKRMKPIIDERLIWFAYYNDTPIAFFVLIPELNQIFRHLNGKLDWIGTIKFLYYQWARKVNKAVGIVVGVLPRFQGRGVESALVSEFSKLVFSQRMQYEEMEFNWAGDFLPAMVHFYENLQAYIAKTHITYRKLFDETKIFERHPVIK